MIDSHKRFADKYFETLNASESAIFAGFSADTARQQGWQLLQREDVQEYLSELRAKEADKNNISRERWLRELISIGFSNIQDYIDVENTIKDISSIDKDSAKAVLSIKKSLTEFDGGEKTVVEFKLHDKLAALEKIGRHLGYFEKDNEQKKPQMIGIMNIDPLSEDATNNGTKENIQP